MSDIGSCEDKGGGGNGAIIENLLAEMQAHVLHEILFALHSDPEW